MIERNADVPDEERIRFRIGVNLGDVIVEPEDIFGDGVNIAARLETLAEPGGICMSSTVRDHIGERLSYPFEDIGEQSVKNIARPVRAYAMNAAAVESLPAVALSGQPIVSTTAAGRTAPTIPRLSIVVLPFLNLFNDPDQEYLADGLTDDLTTDLSRISGSFVIARNTAFTYKSKPVDVKQVGRELDVRYVIEGSVRSVGRQLWVNVQLIDAASGAHLWADRFDVDPANLGEAQGEITGRLARSFDLELVTAAANRIAQERVVAFYRADVRRRRGIRHVRPALDSCKSRPRRPVFPGV
jgi:TolB-like protein